MDKITVIIMTKNYLVPGTQSLNPHTHTKILHANNMLQKILKKLEDA